MKKTHIVLLIVGICFIFISPSFITMGVGKPLSEKEIYAMEDFGIDEFDITDIIVGKKEESRPTFKIETKNNGYTRCMDMVTTDSKIKESKKEREIWDSSGGYMKITSSIKDVIEVEVDFNDGRGKITEKGLEPIKTTSSVLYDVDDKIVSYKASFIRSISVGVEFYPEYTFLEAHELVNGTMTSISFIVDVGINDFSESNTDYILTSEYMVTKSQTKNKLMYEAQYTEDERLKKIDFNDTVTIKDPITTRGVIGGGGGGSSPMSFTLYDISPNPSYNGSIYLSWSISAYATTYDIYCKPYGGSYTKIKDNCYSRTWTHVVTGTIDTTYYYFIRAENSYGSKDSNEESVVINHTPPDAPSLSIYSNTDESVGLLWTSTHKDESYAIYRHETVIDSYSISEATEIHDVDHPIQTCYDGVNYLDSDKFQGIYNFDDDTIGEEPLNWTKLGIIGGDIQVLEELKGVNGDDDHDTVLELYDNDANGDWHMYRNTLNHSGDVGWVEFWLRSSDVTKRSYLKISGDGPEIACIGFDQDKFYIRDDDGMKWMNISEGEVPIDNKWYNLAVFFNRSNMSVDFYVNGVEFYNGTMISNTTGYQIHLYTDFGDSGYRSYFDSISPNWERQREYYFPWYFGASMDKDLPEFPKEGKYYYAVVSRNEYGTSAISNNVHKTFDYDIDMVTEVNTTFISENNTVMVDWTNMTSFYGNTTNLIYRIYKSNDTITSITGMDPISDYHIDNKWTEEVYSNETWYYAVTCAMLESDTSRILKESNPTYSDGLSVNRTFQSSTLSMEIFYNGFWNVIIWQPKAYDYTLAPMASNLAVGLGNEVVLCTGVTASWYVEGEMSPTYFTTMLISICGDYIENGAVYKSDLISMYFMGHSPQGADWWRFNPESSFTWWYLSATFLATIVGVREQDGRIKHVNFADAGIMSYSCYSYRTSAFLIGDIRFECLTWGFVTFGKAAFYSGFRISPNTAYVQLWLIYLICSLALPFMIFRSSYLETLLKFVMMHEAIVLAYWTKWTLINRRSPTPAEYQLEPFWLFRTVEIGGIWTIPTSSIGIFYPIGIMGGTVWKQRIYRPQNYLNAGTLFYVNRKDGGEGYPDIPLPCPTGLFWWYHDSYPVVNYNELTTDDSKYDNYIGMDINWILCSIWTFMMPL